jgi:hypothetical protein
LTKRPKKNRLVRFGCEYEVAVRSRELSSK